MDGGVMKETIATADRRRPVNWLAGRHLWADGRNEYGKSVERISKLYV